MKTRILFKFTERNEHWNPKAMGIRTKFGVLQDCDAIKLVK